jgi:imidazolonepropionase
VSVLVRAARLVTCDPARATAADPLGVVEDGAVLVREGRVVALGTARELVERGLATSLELQMLEHQVHVAPLVTPGLVDAHTHAPWAGSRHAEYALRMAGAGYEAIAAAGGGIVSTTRAVREASREALARELSARLARMASLGVTTVECKSGYGLDLENEQKQLEAVREAGARADLPRLVPTYLALHALPPEARADRAGYVARVASEWLPELSSRGLARFVDAYVDRAAFSCDEARPVLLAARRLGLGVRLHAGQFADVGGAELAASLGAASADHLEVLSPSGARALAAAGTRAVLLPVASFTLGQAPPPVGVLREAGVPLVVASDANPGTAPTESLPLAMALAVRLYGLSVAECLLAVTREAARSLALDDLGVLREGATADLVRWNLPHEEALVEPWGVTRAHAVLREGRALVALHAQSA